MENLLRRTIEIDGHQVEFVYHPTQEITEIQLPDGLTDNQRTLLEKAAREKLQEIAPAWSEELKAAVTKAVKGE